MRTDLTKVASGYVLEVFHGNEHNFVYGIHKEHAQPEFNNNSQSSYYRAEVHLVEGGQDYDVMEWSELEIVNDVIDQYQNIFTIYI